MRHSWLDNLKELFVHHYNETSAIQRGAVAMSYGLEAQQWSHPYPGSNSINFTIPDDGKKEDCKKGGSGWLKTSLMIGALSLGLIGGGYGISSLAKPPPATQAAPPSPPSTHKAVAYERIRERPRADGTWEEIERRPATADEVRELGK